MDQIWIYKEETTLLITNRDRRGILPLAGTSPKPPVFTRVDPVHNTHMKTPWQVFPPTGTIGTRIAPAAECVTRQVCIAVSHKLRKYVFVNALSFSFFCLCACRWSGAARRTCRRSPCWWGMRSSPSTRWSWQDSGRRQLLWSRARTRHCSSPSAGMETSSFSPQTTTEDSLYQGFSTGRSQPKTGSESCFDWSFMMLCWQFSIFEHISKYVYIKRDKAVYFFGRTQYSVQSRYLLDTTEVG